MTKPLVDASEIRTVEDVLRTFKVLDSELSSRNLEQFRLFNTTYCIVTSNVKQAMEAAYFSNPGLIVEFTVGFAQYYFAAINEANSKSSDMAPSWAALSSYAEIDAPPVFLSLMLGANAHVNNDLPLALKALSRHYTDEEIRRDIGKMNKILMKSGRESIGMFEESGKTLDFLKRRFRFMYYRPAMYTILYWRMIVLRNYQHSPSNRSSRIAARLLWLAKLLA